MNTISMSAKSSKLFFGEEGHGLSRYDVVRYPALLKLDEQMKSLFWRPQEVDMSQEKASFNKMTEAEQFVFTSNLRRQILLDSIQGRAPSLTFLDACTDPSLENCIQTWSFFETIHSESYTWIIRAIYPNPSEVFDGIPDIKEIADCATSIGGAYDTFLRTKTKKDLYLALIAANALESIRFYVSFACSFSFAERGLVEASAKVLKFIARDEARHLALVHLIIKLLPEDDSDFIQIIKDNKEEAIAIFEEAAKQEREWINYLFSKGKILGLNEQVLNQYIDYLLPMRLYAAGLSTIKGTIQNPIPWIDKWFTNSNVQVAPQEVEISSYLTGTVVNDLADTKFSF